MNIRKAKLEELEIIEGIYARARSYMKETGNPNQWQDKYPLTEWVVRDIENGDLYVCEEDGELLGVFYFSVEPDPDYVVIEDGAWRNEAAHGIIHRVASSGTRKGVFPFILNYCKGIIGNIRMDTHAENKVMQHVLEKQGFVHCGTVYVRGDSPRMAYHFIENNHKEKGDKKVKKTLIVVDMQKDFVDGALGSKEAVAIVENVKAKVAAYRANGDEVIFTRDTHQADYLSTNEGKYLPVEHCIQGSDGWQIIPELEVEDALVIDKPTFGYLGWKEFAFEEVELIGLCTDICVVSNALIIKAQFPEIKVSVDSACCAGVTPESHQAALATMKMCQVEIV